MTTLIFRAGENLTQCSQIPLGIRAENEVTQVALDFSPWAEEFGAGVVQLLVRRDGDSSPYPVVLTQSGTTATWTVSATDLAEKGPLQAEFIYTVGTLVKKSEVLRFYVLRDIGAPGSAPDPYETWLETLTELAAQTQQDAAAAAGSASAAAESAAGAGRAVSAAEAAQADAEQSAGDAAASAQAAATSEANALSYAQNSASSASASSASAIEAAGYSSNAAQSASASAERATASAASASASAASAADAYRDAERAEQAAASAGYIDVEIVNGNLIYTRTDAVDVDFELDNNGHLLMEVI